MTTNDSKPRGRAQPESLLRDSLQAVLAQDDWMGYKPMIKKLAGDLGLNMLECAAGLAYLALHGEPQILPAKIPTTTPELKMVRYRLEVGRKHQATEEGLKKLLIDESGVEHRRIGRVDIHHDHTLIQLPDGMPGEVYRYLKSVEFNRQPLRIKRLEGNPRGNVKGSKNQQRRRRPPHAHKNPAGRQTKRDVKPQQTD